MTSGDAAQVELGMQQVELDEGTGGGGLVVVVLLVGWMTFWWCCVD